MSERFTHREVGGDAAPLNGGTPKGKRRGQPAPVALWTSTARGRALGRWATACCAAVVLTGCSGESGPAASSGDVAPSDISRIASGNASSSKTTSAPSSTSSNTNGQSRELVVPDAAKAHTHEGAKAYARFYLETLGSLDRTPRTGVIPKLSTSACTSCAKQEETIASFVKTSKRVETKDFKIGSTTVRPDSTEDSVVVQVRHSDGGATEFTRGKKTANFPPTNSHVEVRTDWDGRSWKVGEQGVVAD